MPRVLAQLSLLGTLLTTLLSAQDPSAFPVTGIVVDPHRAGVFGAKITLKRADGTEVQSTTADSNGEFRFGGLPPGNYDVLVEQPGFKPAVSRVRVGSQAPRPLNVALVLAEVRQEVTVGAEAAQVSTNASDNLDTVTMDRSALDNLPIFDQDFIGTMSRFLDASSVGTNHDRFGVAISGARCRAARKPRCSIW